MTLPRRILIDTQQTPYYHCVSRCVRRAFLCGQDALTGYDFEHRRTWIEHRLLELAGVFAIDLCAYAVMSNHYHVVLHINTVRQNAWTSEVVVKRWGQLYCVPEDFERFDTNRQIALVNLWRKRLGDISWFMRCINEPLARLANKEDDCKGRFWEGRFRSQALLDDDAILKCMAYVDLNPIRAGKATSPETSFNTSIKARIEGKDDALAPMADEPPVEEFSLPMRKQEYLTLVDWTGRQFRADKRSRINDRLPPIIERLETQPSVWFNDIRHLTRRYYRAIGNAASLVAFRNHVGQQRLKGLTT